MFFVESLAIPSTHCCIMSTEGRTQQKSPSYLSSSVIGLGGDEPPARTYATQGRGWKSNWSVAEYLVMSTSLAWEVTSMPGKEGPVDFALKLRT